MTDIVCGKVEFVDYRGDSFTPRQPLPVCPVDDAETVKVCGYYSGGSRSLRDVDATFVTYASGVA